MRTGYTSGALRLVAHLGGVASLGWCNNDSGRGSCWGRYRTTQRRLRMGPSSAPPRPGGRTAHRPLRATAEPARRVGRRDRGVPPRARRRAGLSCGTTTRYRLNRVIRRRTDVVGTFLNRARSSGWAGAALAAQHDEGSPPAATCTPTRLQPHAPPPPNPRPRRTSTTYPTPPDPRLRPMTAPTHTPR
jgi:hypothetical protein